MAKVLFVLYVPDDVSTTPGITKELEKDGGKEDSIDGKKSPIPRSSLPVDDSLQAVNTRLQRIKDEQEQIDTVTTGTESDESASKDSTLKTEAALNVTSSCKASDSNSFITAVVSIKEEEDRQESIPLLECPLPEIQAVQTANKADKSHLVDDVELPRLETSMDDATISETAVSQNITESNPDEIHSKTFEYDEICTVLRNFKVGENLTDDYWDFGLEEQAEPSCKADPASSKSPEDEQLPVSSENNSGETPAKISDSPGAEEIGRENETYCKDKNEEELKQVSSFNKRDENRNALGDPPDSDQAGQQQDGKVSDSAAKQNDAKLSDSAQVTTQTAVNDVPTVSQSANEQQDSVPLTVVKIPAAGSMPLLFIHAGVGMQTPSPGTDVDSSTEKPHDMMELVPQRPLKEQVVDCLNGFGVKNVVWIKCPKDRIWQVTFIASSGIRCEEILHTLEGIGLGIIKKSSISVIQISIHSEETDSEEESDVGDDISVKTKDEKTAEENMSEFRKSIKSRMVVAQVVESVRSNAEFTFDYVVLLVVASLIAALGLMESSSVALVASMLISPLMNVQDKLPFVSLCQAFVQMSERALGEQGPILAGTFGTVIHNISLRNCGIRSELYGLGICIISGFLYGLLTAGAEASGINWRSTPGWPTAEMSSRGVYRGLVIGVMIAIPSGAGVALSVLGGNTGSLVGVAISASLLPPAVNAGMLWANAIVAAIVPPGLSLKNKTSDAVYLSQKDTVQCPLPANNDYIHIYFCNVAHEFALLGVISLLLTILNIICIFVMGVLFLKIKEVAPRTSLSNTLKQFFKKDIKVARESYSTVKGPQSAALGRQWLEEYKNMKGISDNNIVEMLEKVNNETDVEAALGILKKSMPINVLHLQRDAADQIFVPVVSAFDTNSPYLTVVPYDQTFTPHSQRRMSKQFTVTKVNENTDINEQTSDPQKNEPPHHPKTKSGRSKGRQKTKKSLRRLSFEEQEPLMGTDADRMPNAHPELTKDTGQSK